MPPRQARESEGSCCRASPKGLLEGCGGGAHLWGLRGAYAGLGQRGVRGCISGEMCERVVAQECGSHIVLCN